MIKLQDKHLLVTGGTGSFGSALIRYLIDNGNQPKKLTVFSRDWIKQKQLRDSLCNPKWINWVIGDVRDKDRLKEAMGLDVTFVIHAAALKCIDACEQNPVECLKTNVLGTQNVIDCLEWVQNSVLISTDKAVQPINIYGTSKKMAEKLWISSGYNVARYGNVIGSAGSVLPLYRRLIAEGAKSLPVTDERMTRFWYPMDDAIRLVLEALDANPSGEMFIPKIPSIRITDLCKALDMPYHVVGIRPGEKLHEYMIAPSDIDDSEGYSSGNNPHFLTVDEIRESIYGI